MTFISKLQMIAASAACVLVLSGCTNSNAGSNSTSTAAQTQQSLAGVSQSGTANQQNAAVPLIKGRWVTVSRVVDGDTVELEGGDRVRMIGVNTPETVKPGEPEQPYGKQASDFTKSQIQGKRLFLETDVQEKDQYGRILGYLYTQEPKNQDELEKYMFNAILLREGYAQLMTIQPNSKYADTFVKFQRQAREGNKGLWALGIYKDASTSTNDVFVQGKAPGKQTTAAANSPSTPTSSSSNAPASSAAQTAAPQSQAGCAKPMIKGNHSSSGELIYHVPGGAYYDRTKAEEMFCTEAEAQAAGYRASKR